MIPSLPELMSHQILARDHILAQPKAALWLDVGGSKTLSTLVGLFHARPAGHILVVAPASIARSTWFDEIEKWGFPLRTKSLIDNDNDRAYSRKKRHEVYQHVLTDPPTMYFITVGLIHDLVDQMPKKAGVIQWPFTTVIIDEAQEFMNPQSRRFKALKKVQPAISRMVQLTGTPAPSGLLDLWSQIYLLDGGQALGRRFSDYRAEFFVPTMYVQNRPVKWEPRDGAKEEIYRRINHLVMSAENVSIPKPPITYQQVNIRLPKDVQKEYRQFAKDMVLELAHPDPKDPRTIIITGDNAAIMHNKLLQYASGTMYTDDSTALDRPYAVVHTEKLEMTDYLIRNNGGSPVIVAHRFKSDRTQLLNYLTKAGHQVSIFDGSRAMVADWNAGKIEVLLLQPQSARHGLNMQEGGHTFIWYTLPDSYEYYHQANGRIARLGQKNPVTIYSLVTTGTRDERLPQMLDAKKTTTNDLVEAMRHDLDDLLDEDETMEDLLGDLDINPL